MPESMLMNLDAADRHALAVWLDATAAMGIDTAIDLTARPWDIAGVGRVLGVFETNQQRASWVLVECGGWAAMRCEDGFITGVSASLSTVLDRIDLAG